MSTIIRADTDQLRAVARQMRTTADEIMSGASAMHQAMGALDATWSGSARDRGMARWGEITPKYPPAVERLIHFANELEALAQRLDDAAAVFGAGGTNMVSHVRKLLQEVIEGLLREIGREHKPWWPLPALPPGFHFPNSLPGGIIATPDTPFPDSVPPRIYIANGINSQAPDDKPDTSSTELKQTLVDGGYSDPSQIVPLNAVYNSHVGSPNLQGTNLQGTNLQGTNYGGVLSPLDWMTKAGAGFINTSTNIAADGINTVTGTGAGLVNGAVEPYNIVADSKEVYDEYMQGEHGLYTEKTISNIQRDLEMHPLAPGQKVIVIGYSGGGALSSNATPILEEMGPVRRSDGSYETIDVEGTVLMGSPVANVDEASRYSKVLDIRDAGDLIGTPIIRSEESRRMIPSGAILGGIAKHPLIGAFGGLATGEALRDHNPNIVSEETHSGRSGVDAHMNAYQKSPEVVALLKKYYPSVAKAMERK